MTSVVTKPYISIVIPALNEADVIQRCLLSVNNLNYPKDLYEVIVVDNGSTDGTQNIALECGALVFEFPDVKIGRLRNLGVEQAKGDIIAFVDADCLPPKNWLINALKVLTDSNVGVVGGNIKCPMDASWIEKYWALEKGDVFTEVTTLATGSFIINRSVFDEVGGFNESLVAGEDTEISQRILYDTGKKLMLSSECDVIHLGYPKTILSFVKRQVWQTTDYLNSLKSGLDKTFILTALFSVSFFSLLLALAFGWCFLVLSSLFLVAIPPLLGAVFRLKQCTSNVTIKTILSVFMVQFLYFSGRSIGLCISLSKKVCGKYR